MTGWLVPVPEAERVAERLSEATLAAGTTAFRSFGCVLLRGLWAPELVDALRRVFAAAWGGDDREAMLARSRRPAPNPVMEVGADRYEITPGLSGAFAEPRVFANPLVLQAVEALLGDDIQISSLSVVVSYPGAELQHQHRDFSHLFPESGLGAVLPPYAINVSVPLIDVDLEMGPTAVWPGSHRLANGVRPDADAMSRLAFERGDCLLLDYRTLHAGLPNRGATPRPILYLVYARPWFFDEANHRKRRPLDMELDAYARLAPGHKALLVRAYSNSVRREQ